MFNKKTYNKDEVLGALALFNQKIDDLRQAHERSTAANEEAHREFKATLFGSQGTSGINGRMIRAETRVKDLDKDVKDIVIKVNGRDGKGGVIAEVARIGQQQKTWNRGFLLSHLTQASLLVSKFFGT